MGTAVIATVAMIVGACLGVALTVGAAAWAGRGVHR